MYDSYKGNAAALGCEAEQIASCEPELIRILQRIEALRERAGKCADRLNGTAERLLGSQPETCATGTPITVSPNGLIAGIDDRLTELSRTIGNIEDAADSLARLG